MGIQVAEAGWVAHRSAGSLLGPSQSKPGLEHQSHSPGETREVVGPNRSHNCRVAHSLRLCLGAWSPSFL